MEKQRYSELTRAVGSLDAEEGRVKTNEERVKETGSEKEETVPQSGDKSMETHEV